MQREINTIVDGFASEFKKNMLAVFTFFFTVIIDVYKRQAQGCAGCSACHHKPIAKSRAER